MTQQADIVMLGFCGWDYLAIVPRIPIDDKVQLIESLEQGGGPAATAAVTAARLGARTAFLGKVGDDPRGGNIVAELRREGVDVSGLLVEEGATSSTAFCWIEQNTGKRSIAWQKGSARDLTPKEVPLDLVRGAKVLHLDGHQAEGASAAAEEARHAGVTVSLDAGSYSPRMDGLMKRCQVVIASEVFARDLIGRDDPEAAVRQIARCGAEVAVITRGARGCICLTADGLLRKQAFPVEVVDTTGAGDVFHGAFCVALAEGWPVERALDFAGATAALKCLRLGGRTGIPRRDTVMEFLRKSTVWQCNGCA